MKKNNMFARKNSSCIDYDVCEELLQEGYSDKEISNEIGINENYIKKLREDYLRDY